MEKILIIVVIAVPVVGYIWYTQIISKRNSVLEALGSVDAVLQQRADLIPNMLRAAKRFMEHEKDLLEEVTKLRNMASADYDKSNQSEVQNHFSAVDSLAASLGKLRIQVEAYPELKSDQTMTEAMDAMEETEAQISAARRAYNASVTALNNSIQIFPGSYIASIANVTAMPYYEASEGASAPINADEFLR